MADSRGKTIFGTVISVLVVFAALGIAFIFSGTYDVAASRPPSKLEHWVLTTARDHSIDRRAGNLQIPSLDDPQRIREGFAHYREMCVDCHGAPGHGREEFAEGMNPEPPTFYRKPRLGGAERPPDGERPPGAEGSSSEHERKELRHRFWVIKHGIAMTGMPAFGKDHSDEDIWNLLAFVQHLRRMTPAAWDSLDAAVPPEEHEGEGAAEGTEGQEPGHVHVPGEEHGADED